MEAKDGAVWAEAKHEEKRALEMALDDDEQPSVASMLSSVCMEPSGFTGQY